jgi:hypothetical protein
LLFSLLRAAARKAGSVYDDALAPRRINIAQYSLLRLILRRQPVSFTELGASPNSIAPPSGAMCACWSVLA